MARFYPLATGLMLVLAATAQAAGERHRGAANRPVRYEPRADSIPAPLADEQGQIVAANCIACHSLDYITTQPRGKGTQFWRDAVTKMVNVYKAPISPADADATVLVLDQKFGGKG